MKACSISHKIVMYEIASVLFNVAGLSMGMESSVYTNGCGLVGKMAVGLGVGGGEGGWEEEDPPTLGTCIILCMYMYLIQ